MAALVLSRELLLAPIPKPFINSSRPLSSSQPYIFQVRLCSFSFCHREEGISAQGPGPSIGAFLYAHCILIKKKLDHTIQGWTPCLHALAAAKLLLQDKKVHLWVTQYYHLCSPLSRLLTHRGLQTRFHSSIIFLRTTLLKEPTLTSQPCPCLNISN